MGSWGGVHLEACPVKARICNLPPLLPSLLVRGEEAFQFLPQAHTSTWAPRCSLSHILELLPLSPVLEVAFFFFFLDHSQQDKNMPGHPPSLIYSFLFCLHPSFSLGVQNYFSSQQNFSKELSAPALLEHIPLLWSYHFPETAPVKVSGDFHAPTSRSSLTPWSC